MSTPIYKRSAFLACLLLLLLLLGSVLLTWRAWRKVKLDHALIAHIKANDADAVIADLQHGANPNARDTADIHVFWWQSVRQSVMHQRPDTRRDTALNYAFGSEPSRDPSLLFPRSSILNTKLVAALLKAGANPNTPSIDHASPLFKALLLSRPQMVRLLIDYHADVNTTVSDGLTPLMFAVETGNFKTARLLLEHHANVNVSTKARGTPLSAAINNGSKEGVKLLLSYHADVDLPGYGGRTPLIQAKASKQLRIVHLLLQAGAKR